MLVENARYAPRLAVAKTLMAIIRDRHAVAPGRMEKQIRGWENGFIYTRSLSWLPPWVPFDTLDEPGFRALAGAAKAASPFAAELIR